MREILFRGKWDGEWIVGDYTSTTDGTVKQHFIIDERRHTYVVDPETVGQYTGMNDKAGRRIFEGDIIKAVMNGGNYDQYEFPLGQVVFEHGAFCLRDRRETTPLCSFAPAVSFEIIGNIYDTPELLRGAENGA